MLNAAEFNPHLYLERYLDGYMRHRCEVSSQHKLPTKEELHDSVFVTLYGLQDEVDKLIKAKVEAGTWFQYGPYLSDHEIEVM